MAALFGLAGCGGTREAPPAGSLGALTPLADQNPDPRVVEVQLVAGAATVEFLAGKPVQALAYRDGAVPGSVGTIPGPLLEARRGDQVIVHYRNETAVNTTVHWHGLRLPNAADGTPSSQMAVPPGGTYTYSFMALDAGTFWYHPHMEADVLIERGLHGAVRVLDDEPPVSADRVLVLDDVKLNADGQFSTVTDSLDVMLGRQGNVLLVNGKVRPDVTVKAGTRERWRFVNTANGRFFNLSFGGRPFLVIAWDAGLLPQPYSTATLLLAPGERYEVLMNFGHEDADTSLVLQTVHYDRGHNIPNPGPLDLVQFNVRRGLAGDPAEVQANFPLGSWQPLPVTASTARRRFELREEEHAAFPKFFINDEQFPHHTPIVGMENDLAIWEIHNETEMDHPFHLHGMFFQVLDVNGVAPVHRGLKDTVNVPQKAKLRFAVQYGPPGNWMYHCHILEHAERGMMGELRIGTPGGPPPLPHPTTTHP
jgi:FtsP/CotA-like multicopper oxidase with cupredoxin domain